MSTDKQNFALHCDAKNEGARKRLGIKGGFFWTEAKNFLLRFHAALLQWTMLATMKMTLKTRSRKFPRRE